jgi:hypothetical protein
MATNSTYTGDFLPPYLVLLNQVIKATHMVAMASGTARNVTEATGLWIPGVAEDTVDATGSSVMEVSVDNRPYLFDIGEGGDVLTDSDLGATVYAINGRTVGKVATGRSAAGKLLKVIGGKALVAFASR